MRSFWLELVDPGDDDRDDPGVGGKDPLVAEIKDFAIAKEAFKSKEAQLYK